VTKEGILSAEEDQEVQIHPIDQPPSGVRKGDTIARAHRHHFPNSLLRVLEEIDNLDATGFFISLEDLRAKIDA
jgi:hypothetical protein